MNQPMDASDRIKALAMTPHPESPDGSLLPFVRFSKDMSRVELIVQGVGVIDRLKIKGGDPHKVRETLVRKAVDFYRFHNVQ